MRKSQMLIVIALLIALGAAGCGGASVLRTWYVDSLVKVFPDDKPGMNELSDKTWLVARNGHINIQVALRSERAVPLQNVQTVINDDRTLLPAGDNAIVYPNAEKLSVRSSIRLEAMREGIEDYALLKELDRKDRALAQKIAGEAVKTFVDYVRGPREFRAIRQKVLEAP